jgi:hypothetical protein
MRQQSLRCVALAAIVGTVLALGAAQPANARLARESPRGARWLQLPDLKAAVNSLLARLTAIWAEEEAKVSAGG